MAYTPWSVVSLEQPSASKWNILGTNDSAFNDGSGIGNNAILLQHLSLVTMSLRDGDMINGKIVTSVASNNLTVAIKTYAGTNPSASDPVWIKINGTLRSITAALSVTLNAGTNYFASGSADIATNEVDYFTYLGYDASGAAVRLGFARISQGILYSDFSSTNTNDKYLATSGSLSASDSVVNIGRFNATLSATASFNWSIPATSIIINHREYMTRWLTYTPTITAGSGAFTSVTGTGTYIMHGRVVLTKTKIVITTNGTAATDVEFTLPINCATVSFRDEGAGREVAASGFITSVEIPDNAPSNLAYVRKQDGSYPGGTSNQLMSTIAYQI